jgi:lipoyl(octanoyl) transferase
MTENFPLTTWRLILSDPKPGALNMAVDSAILAAVERGEAPPTLRLYRWDPPCLSLGYSQAYSDIDLGLLTANNWDVVRRPTGGRAILHIDELTYAVIGPKNDPRLAGNLMNSYQQISRALFDALSRMGLPVEVHAGKNPEAHHQPVCFENPSDFEITAAGKKIIGSAQARKKISLLQHGSLPLVGDLARITKALRYSSDTERCQAGEALLQKASTVYDVLKVEISWDQAAKTFVDSFSRVLNLKLVEGDLSPNEKDHACQLESSQFGHPDWTQGTRPLKASG